MLELRKITKIYEVGDISQTALNGVSLNFRQSEFAAILGPSGSGKTTLAKMVFPEKNIYHLMIKQFET